MALKYFALLTNIGAAKLSNMAALGEKLDITSLAVGDGGGASPTPHQAQTKLINEVRRAQLNSLSVDKDNDSQIIAEQIIPESAGGWWIREIGLFDADGDLIAIANCPETYKATTEEGSGRTQVIRMLLAVSSTDAVTLKIDPSVVLATRQYVDDAVIEVKAYADQLMAVHEAKANPHGQYLLIEKASGRLSRIVKLESSGMYSIPDGVSSIIVEVSGGGGAGGSVGPITAGKVFAGGGGQSGAYAKSYYSRDELPDAIPVIIGAGAVSVKNETTATANTSGGTTSFGDLIVCKGGNGATGALVTPPYVGLNSSMTAPATGGNIINVVGMDGADTFVLSTTAVSAGVGGFNALGGQHLDRVSTGNGNGPNVPGFEVGTAGYGSGGSGAMNFTSGTDYYLGGDGTQGVVIIYEYS